MSLTSELVKNFEHLVESITILPSDGGRFEVVVNGNLIFSKLQTHRHAEQGEIVGLISKMVEQEN